MLSENGDEILMITISDDEDVDAVGSPSRSTDESRKSSGSAMLPTPPPIVPAVFDARGSGRPSSLPPAVSPLHNQNSSDGRRSVNLPNSSTPFSSSDVSRSRQGSNTSISPLPIIIPPYRNENRGVDDFLHRINAGRMIACLLCEEQFAERPLLKHVNEKHFWSYRPFRCGQCGYRIGDIDLLINDHLAKTNHDYGVRNFQVIGERNENIELVIKIIFEHSVLAHGKSDQDKMKLIRRIDDACRALRSKRLECSDHTDMDDDNDDFEGGDAVATSDIPMPPSPGASDGDVDMGNRSCPTEATDESVVSSSTPGMEKHRRARHSASAAVDEIGPQGEPETMDTTELSRATGSDSNIVVGNDITGSFDVSGGNDAETPTVECSPPPVLMPEINRQELSYSPPPVLMPEATDAVPEAAADPVPSASNAIEVKVQASPFTCTFCQPPRPSPHLKYLQFHSAQVHTGGYTLFKCTDPECGFGTWRRWDFRKHLEDQHGIKEGKIHMMKPTPMQVRQMQLVVNNFRARGLAEPEEIKIVLDRFGKLE